MSKRKKKSEESNGKAPEIIQNYRPFETDDLKKLKEQLKENTNEK